MNISFRTKAGGEYGWGNLIRLYNLYLNLKKNKPNFKYNFIIEGDNEIFNFLKKKKINHFKLKNRISIKDEFDILKKRKEKDYIICEMLDLSYERQVMFKKIYNKLVVLDDLINQKYCADIVICAQEWPLYQNVNISDKDAKFLIGYDYFIFSKYYEFYRKKRLERKINKNINSIVVVLGGADYEIAYKNVALALKNIDTNVKVCFILGFSSINKKKKIIKSILPKAEIKSNISNVPKYIYEADIAIVGGGYTKVESAFLLTPCIVISVQWHQIPLSDYFSSITNSPHLGYYTLFDEKIILKNIKKLKSIKKRLKIIKSYKEMFKNNSNKALISKIF